MALCQGLTEEMVGILAAIARNEDASTAARVNAAEAILDRGNGKPAQSVEHSGTIEHSLVQLLAAAYPDENIIDVEPTEIPEVIEDKSAG
jgi:hypothetical protein